MTILEKEQYFAAHWSLDAFYDKRVFAGFRHPVDRSTANVWIHGYLELTPLSNITDEDAIEVGFGIKEHHKGNYKIEWPFSYDSHWKLFYNGDFQHEGYLIPKDIDFLRSKRYALPWRHYTIEDLIKEGVLKLRS